MGGPRPYKLQTKPFHADDTTVEDLILKQGVDSCKVRISMENRPHGPTAVGQGALLSSIFSGGAKLMERERESERAREKDYIHPVGYIQRASSHGLQSPRSHCSLEVLGF